MRTQFIKIKSKGGGTKTLIHTKMTLHELRKLAKFCQEPHALGLNYTVGWYKK
jgi:hypothetical protein